MRVFVVSTLQLFWYVWLCKAKALHHSLSSAHANVALSQVYLSKLACENPDDSNDPETPVGVGTTGAKLDDKLSEEKKGRGGKVDKCAKEDWPTLFCLPTCTTFYAAEQPPIRWLYLHFQTFRICRHCWPNLVRCIESLFQLR